MKGVFSMRLLFKQKFFSWLDSYDIYDEHENVVFTVKGKVGFGHRFDVYDASGNQVGEIREVIFRFLPKFELYVGGELMGTVTKKFRLLEQNFEVDFNGWSVDGNFTGWDYAIYDATSNQIASISKQLFNFTDTYVIDVANPQNALCALMLTVAIDAEKQSNNNN